MDQILTALEIYRNQNGYMPGWGGSCDFTNASNVGGIAQKLNDPDNTYRCMVDELASVMNGRVPIDPLAENDADYYYVYDNWHGNTSGKCDNEPSVTISFNSSETGINDQHTTSGCDQNVCNADFNRIICLD
jgi:hypothetical protein